MSVAGFSKYQYVWFDILVNSPNDLSLFVNTVVIYSLTCIYLTYLRPLLLSPHGITKVLCLETGAHWEKLILARQVHMTHMRPFHFLWGWVGFEHVSVCVISTCVLCVSQYINMHDLIFLSIRINLSLYMITVLINRLMCIYLNNLRPLLLSLHEITNVLCFDTNAPWDKLILAGQGPISKWPSM